LNTGPKDEGDGMDALLQMILVLIVFAVLIFLISRSVKVMFALGIVFVALIALKYFGVMG
jgi:hypothetical protein